MKKFDGAMANGIRNQLKCEGTFTKTGIEDVEARFMGELTRIQRIINFYSKKNNDRAMTRKSL